MRISYLLLLFFLAIVASCKKDKPAPAPYEKVNYMSANINGEYWENCGPIQYSDLSAQYFPGKYFDMEGHADCVREPYKSYPTIYIYIYNLNDTGIYYLDGNNKGVYYYYIKSTMDKIKYSTDIIHTGKVHITTFDIQRAKVSGTFEFEAYNADSNKVIKITDGKFNKVTFYTF